MELFNKKLGVFVTPNCNIQCAHCMCTDVQFPGLAKSETQNVINILKDLNADTVHLTGGEPTLNLSTIHCLVKSILRELPNINFEITTNAWFSNSFDSCYKVIGNIPNLKKVIVSYDKYHARFINIDNVKNLVLYCNDKDINISLISTIASPEDLADNYKYEKEFDVEFEFQRTLPIGNAKKNHLDYKYYSFESEVLNKKCPRLSYLVYLPSYGVTHCCSSLLHCGFSSMNNRIIKKNVKQYIKSRFFNLLNRYNFNELIAMLGIRPNELSADCSSICQLCLNIIPPLLLDSDKRH
ncbi:MAG: radical SAM protein [Pseudomonadota bacterium]